MRSVIVGGSAGLGRALAAQLAERGSSLVLVARDERDLAAEASDLELRYAVSVEVVACDVAQADPEDLFARCTRSSEAIDAVFVMVGATHPDDFGVLPDRLVDELVRVNFAAPMRLINLVFARLPPNVDIIVAGSVASIRPRGANCVYASSKAALEFYLQALAHAQPSRPGALCCYRLGYLRTAMTFGQSLPLPSWPPEKAAEHIVRRLGRDRGVVYLPGWWRWAALFLGSLPWAIYGRLSLGRRER